jgi:hypothetical protein
MTDDSLSSPAVPFAVKVSFWVLLGALSVEFAEVTCASDPFPFFRIWGWMVTFPLYTLHVLLLSYFAFGKQRVTLTSLFLAGAILGMYEAYITKVLWSPTWGESFTWKIGGVAVIQTAILVLFWHPFMAFVLPVFVAEILFTSSRETFEALPSVVRRALGTKKRFLLAVFAFAIYAGIYQSGGFQPDGLRTLWKPLLSGSSTVSFLFLLGGVWRWIRRGRDYSFRELLPSKRAALVLGLLVFLLYLLTGIFLRPEALPRTLTPHLAVWAIYGVLITLFYFEAKHAPLWASMGPSPLRPFSIQAGLLFGVPFTATSTLFVLFARNLGRAGHAVSVGSWFVGCSAGMALLVWATRSIVSLQRCNHGETRVWPACKRTP